MFEWKSDLSLINIFFFSFLIGLYKQTTRFLIALSLVVGRGRGGPISFEGGRYEREREREKEREREREIEKERKRKRETARRTL